MDNLQRNQQSPEQSAPPQFAQSAPALEDVTAKSSTQREFILKIYLASAAAVVLLSLAIFLMMLFV